MFEFRFAVLVGGKEAIVNEPEPVEFRVDVNAGDDADAANDRMNVAALLAAHQFDGARIVLVGHSVVKDQITIGRRDELPTGLFPHHAGRQFVITQVAVQLVVTELDGVVGKVRQGVVDLAAHQILTNNPSASVVCWKPCANYQDFCPFA